MVATSDKTITEASVRRHLKLADADGISTLPTTEIFELALMGKTRNRTRRIGIRIPESNVLSSVADEAITKEMHDGLGRATTTASSLETEQGSGNIFKTQTNATLSRPSSPRTSSEGGPWCHVTIGGSSVQARPERLSNLPNEPPLEEGNTSRSEEGSMQLLELMDICTKLSGKVTALENELSSTKAVYNKALITLTKRVKKLEKKPKLKRRSAVVDSSEDEEASLHNEDSSKQGRMIKEIDEDENVNLVKRSKQGEAHDTVRHRMESDDTEVVDFSKAIMQESEPPKKRKKKEMIQIGHDEELAQKLHAEELVKDTSRQEQERSFSIAEVRKNMCIYLKNQGGYKQIYFKGMSYADIRPIFERYDPLAVKSLVVSWKSYCKEDVGYYEIHRADGSYKTYMFFSEMLNDFDREDLIVLYRLFNEKYASTRLGFDELMLWGDMKIMFEPNDDDAVWKNHHSQELIEWKLYDSCGVHSLMLGEVSIHMLVEKKYPLPQDTLMRMLQWKLHVNYNVIEMAYKLLRQAKESIKVWDQYHAIVESDSQLCFLVVLRRCCSGDYVGFLVGYCVYKMDLSNYEVPRVLVTCRSRLDQDDWTENCILIHFMLGRQIELLGDETDIVPLYYHIVDNFQIQFGREEFCLVTGLRFGVEYSDDYDNDEDPIPFRRRVFPSSLDGKAITGKTVEKLIDSELFKKLHDDDAVSLCCVDILQFVLLGLEDRRRVPDLILRDENVRRWPNVYATEASKDVDKKTYSIFRFTWAFKTWIWESFRVGTNEYYKRQRRYPRVVAWSSNKKFYLNMLCGFLHGRLPAERLTPDEIEARSDWWVSSRAYFDGRISEAGRIPRHLNCQNHYEVPLEIYLQIEEEKGRWIKCWKRRLNGKKLNSKGGLSYFPTQGNNSFFEMPSRLATPNWQTPIPSHHHDAGLFNLNILNRARREARPRMYMLSPYTNLPPSTVVPKKHDNKTKNKSKNANLSAFNLGNAFDEDNVRGDDLMFLGEHETGHCLVYENVDPGKVRRGNYIDCMEFMLNPYDVYLDCHMMGYMVPDYFWHQLVPHMCMPGSHSHEWANQEGWLSDHHMNALMELLIKGRTQNNRWTVSKSGTLCVHPENKRFMIETDQHIIGALDGSTRLYPAWSDVDWVLIYVQNFNSFYV
ncbi:hypothetical protein Tco_0472041 [Tanacetum coccineum]